MRKHNFLGLFGISAACFMVVGACYAAKTSTFLYDFEVLKPSTCNITTSEVANGTKVTSTCGSEVKEFTVTNGQNGDTPSITVSDGYIKVDNTNLVALSDLAGKDGVDGKTPSFAMNGDNLEVTIGETTTSLGKVKGDKGDKGENGNDGTPGHSCSVTTNSKTGDTAVVGITCGTNAEQMLTVKDGVDGKTPSFAMNGDNLEVTIGETTTSLGKVKGDKGDKGEDGTTPTITADADGNLKVNGNNVVTGIITTGNLANNNIVRSTDTEYLSIKEKAAGALQKTGLNDALAEANVLTSDTTGKADLAAAVAQVLSEAGSCGITDTKVTCTSSLAMALRNAVVDSGASSVAKAEESSDN